MKRAFYAVLIVAALAAIWVVGGSTPAADGTYRVSIQPDGEARLALEVAHSGLFLDVRQGNVSAVTVAGQPARTLKPWPGSDRTRVLTFFRGPVALTAARGAGPLDMERLPAPVAGAEPRLSLPTGWTAVGHYVGPLETVQTQPVRVAVPVGMEKSREAVDRVNKLYTAADAAIGLQPWREPVVVLTGPTALEGARAVVDLWVPDYPAELDWWEAGLKELLVLRLMDDLKLWEGANQKEKWTNDPARGKGFSMTFWLDLSLKLDTNRKQGVTDLFRAAYPVRTTKELLAKVKEMGSLTTYDLVDRKLKGKEPWPRL
ncbi:MAG TPA: hypothetical protein VGK74_20860 [Symbiobacteriaceae bacterium]|jgi:hypothetical protein